MKEVKVKKSRNKVLSDEEKEFCKCIGKRLTELRMNAGYTSQETFANDADISRALYGRYEKGANLTAQSLHRVLKFHKMSVKEFFNDGFDGF
jgi:transcriptional regulator with XRE-family HTH domain